MADNLFGGNNRRCVLLLDLDILGKLLYVPAGGRVTGVEYDHVRKLLKIGVEGGVSGSVVAPGGSPDEIIALVDTHHEVHIVRWPDDASSSPAGRTVPVPDGKPVLNFGQNIMPPPVASAKDEPKIVEMGKVAEPKPATSPCEAPEGDDETT